MAWLGDFPRYFNEQIVNMRAGLKRGFTPPQVTLKGRDLSISAVAGAQGEKNPFYGPFKEMLNTIPAADQARLRAAAVKAIHDAVDPSYAKLLKFMREEYVPGAVTTLGAESFPDGKAYYRAQILEYTTLDMDPDAIHKLWLDEVAHIHA